MIVSIRRIIELSSPARSDSTRPSRADWSRAITWILSGNLKFTEPHVMALRFPVATRWAASLSGQRRTSIYTTPGDSYRAAAAASSSLSAASRKGRQIQFSSVVDSYLAVSIS